MGTNLENEATWETAVNASLDNFVREGTAGPPVLDGERSEAGAEHLVAVRTDVLHDAEHAIGNLFQRLYHTSRAAREGLGPHAERLTNSLQDLERLLELLFDYVTPAELDLQPQPSARLAESLAAHLRAYTAVEVGGGGFPEAAVLVDPRIIGRALNLVARGFVRRVRDDTPIELRVERNGASERVEISLSSAAVAAVPPADVRLALGVASRLVELHGGEVVFAADGGSIRCVVSLPMAPAGN